MFKEIFYKYSEKSRKKKCRLFFDVLKPLPTDILLDAGGRQVRDFITYGIRLNYHSV